MTFRMEALPANTFQTLFGLSTQELEAQGARQMVVTEAAATPCRISLEDAAPGEAVVLASFVHQRARSPFAASGPIFVRQGVLRAIPSPGEIPPAIYARLISLRAYDHAHEIADADIAPGSELPALIERFFANPDVSYLHAHFARRGCYAARFVRA